MLIEEQQEAWIAEQTIEVGSPRKQLENSQAPGADHQLFEEATIKRAL